MDLNGRFLHVFFSFAVFVFSDAIYVYIKVSPIVHGKFGEVTIYEKPELCGDIIVEGDSLGYEIARLGPFNYSCRLIERIDFFERRQDSSPTAFPYYYLVDKREVLECPANSGPYPLKCSKGEMPKPRSSECCPFIAHSNGTRMCCPEGKFPGTYDGEGVCCPEKTSCCLEGEGVVRVENGEAICMKKERPFVTTPTTTSTTTTETTIPTTTTTSTEAATTAIAKGCPKDKMQEGGRCCYYITRNKRRSCCPEGKFPGTYDGEGVCCPEKTSCCPEGEDMVKVENGEAVCKKKEEKTDQPSSTSTTPTTASTTTTETTTTITSTEAATTTTAEKCPKGQMLKPEGAGCCSFITDKGQSSCCPDGMFSGTYDGKGVCCPEKGSCCPAGQEVVARVDNRAICCPKGKRTVIGSSQCCYAIKKKGRDVCCPEGTFPGKDANSNEVCCPQEKTCCPQGTVITGEENGRATCCPKGEAFQKALGGKDLCCPRGQKMLGTSSQCCYTIKQRDGQEVCCPKGRFPGKDKTGDELCCPQKDGCCPAGQEVGGRIIDDAICCPKGEEFKGIHENQYVCCPQGQSLLKEASKCCWAIGKQDGTDMCCPSNTFPGKDDKGAEVCCPQKENCCPAGQEVGGRDGYKAICCPKGKVFIRKEAGIDVCCAKGTEFKGMVDMKPVCCPPEMRLTKGTSKCCSHTLQYNPVFGKCIGTVKIVGKPQNQREMNKHCSDIGAQPVKIVNKEQNDVIEHSIIGLQIPEGWEWGKENFRWVSDNSKPNYTNWRFTEPNNMQAFYGTEVFVFSEAIYVYIKVSPIVHGEFGEVIIYEKPERCGNIIVEGDSLGYEIARLGPFNYSCRLIERIDFFERRQDSSPTAFPYYYLVDKREVLECPAMLGPYPFDEQKKLKEYEIVLDLLAGVRFSAPFIGVLNQYSHNFFLQQATSITRLTLEEVDRPEDYELLVKLIAMENLEECQIRNFDRKLNFIAVEACVEKWKANEQFRFRLISSGAYSKQEIEPLFGEADEDGYYALIVEGHMSRYAGLRLGPPLRRKRYTVCGAWPFE
ncbi:hypothetical protein QR680_008072 [Steinernema hermaphroditum]|uniref:C-type lectin domain-containing protein n=1 Tax=Steinernema hermaphroditum TaxID=289476 RepID=A0AA39IFB1_9BILA|nr:hypothetical protein QR680_008072 [Steinernema hermaphroditum]